MTAKQKVKELREKQDSELEFDRKELGQELFDLRFKSSAEGLANPNRIREIRRSVALINTILNERANGIRGASPKV